MLMADGLRLPRYLRLAHDSEDVEGIIIIDHAVVSVEGAVIPPCESLADFGTAIADHTGWNAAPWRVDSSGNSSVLDTRSPSARQRRRRGC